MLEYYVMNCELYHNEEKIFHKVRDYIVEEYDGDEDKYETIEFTWDNLDELHKKYERWDELYVDQNKKGRIIKCINLAGVYKDLNLKEWKHKDLNLKLRIVRKKLKNPPIKDILNYFDGSVALQYIKERL